jgi:predicted RNA-binding protein with PIN domain
MDTGDEHPQGLEPLPSARLWLVDGYNALHSAPFRSSPRSQKPFWSNTMRERLVAFARCFPDPHAEIWLVFDGSRTPEDPERGGQPRVTLEFSPSADDWIVERVRNAEDPSTIAVVSGDRQLTGRARHHGASVVSPRLFLSHCRAGEALR